MDVPPNIARLLVAYFSRTITEAEKRILDTWICESDAHMKLFGDCLEQSLQPVIYDRERDDGDVISVIPFPSN
jgi:hypothetical protein